MGQFYREALPFVSHVVVPSTKMKTLVNGFFLGEIDIIPDPIEVPILSPKTLSLKESFTLLWFGHSTNIDYLMSYLENKTLCDSAFNLLILSNEAGLRKLVAKPLDTHARIQAKFVPWSVTSMVEAASACDACIIPSNAEDSKKAGASSNRLITAFALGLPTLAEKLASYDPYAGHFGDIRSIKMSAFLNCLNVETEKILQAQKDIVPLYTPQVLAQKWENVLSKAS